MPALKPATIGQKFLTDCGQNRPLTTIKDYLYSIQNELNIMNNALNEVETISPLITINICNKLSLLLKDIRNVSGSLRANINKNIV